MIDALPFPAMVIRTDGLIARINAGAEALFGRNIAGRPHGMHLRSPDLLDAIARTLAGDQPEPVSDTPYLIHVRRGTEGAVLIWQDQTDAESISQMRRDFVANVSHELRSPLTSLMGFVETLQGPAGGDAAARSRFLDIMALEAKRMNRLIGDLLSLSAVEASERMRPRTPVDLAGLARAVITRLAPQSGEDRIVAELPAQILTVQGDADQLGQALSNLVENALRYGKPEGKVTVRLDTVEDAILMTTAARLSVRDEGEGIAPHHIPRLTERFYRVDSHRSRELGGTGLGLAIVKHIASRHRGRLKIESQPGKGSVFTILLPLS